MADFTDDKVKIRFKFRSGDEFEAEGSPEFIEKQRTDFLQLIDQQRTARAPRRNAPAPAAMAPAPEQPAASFQSAQAPLGATLPTGLEPAFSDDMSSADLNSVEPAFYRRPAVQHTQALSDLQQPTMGRFSAGKHLSEGHLPPTISQGISAAERAAMRRMPSSGEGEREMSPDIRLWEEIVRVEDQMVLLRRKNRLLTPETAAVVLLAAARILLRQSDGYSALALSKSLKKSGYGGERLDRVLGGEMKIGTVRSVGSKRSRLYFLSDEGFAKAYTLAEKLANPQP